MLTVAAIKDDGAFSLDLPLSSVTELHCARHADVELREDLVGSIHVVRRPGIKVPGCVTAITVLHGAGLGLLLVQQNMLDMLVHRNGER
jgi:hypothetical protein